MIIAKVTDSRIRAIAKSAPITLQVRAMARIFVAGAVYRKATAGPSPAPFFLIPAKRGRTVQEQTARRRPETTAIG